ncbi:MAG: 4Fe-4S dicluster domain-containing protein [Candidatus Bathyarchaeia archaeon]
MPYPIARKRYILDAYLIVDFIMDKQKSPITIDLAKCGPCTGQICIGVCPQGVLEESKNRKPQIVTIVTCTKCGICVNLCPNKAITLNIDHPQKITK